MPSFFSKASISWPNDHLLLYTILPGQPTPHQSRGQGREGMSSNCEPVPGCEARHCSPYTNMWVAQNKKRYDLNNARVLDGWVVRSDALKSGRFVCQHVALRKCCVFVAIPGTDTPSPSMDGRDVLGTCNLKVARGTIATRASLTYDCAASIGTELALFRGSGHVCMCVLCSRGLTLQKTSNCKLSHLGQRKMPPTDGTLRVLRRRADHQGVVRVWQRSTQSGSPRVGDLSVVVDTIAKVVFLAEKSVQDVRCGLGVEPSCRRLCGVGVGSDTTDRRGSVRGLGSWWSRSWDCICAVVLSRRCQSQGWKFRAILLLRCASLATVPAQSGILKVHEPSVVACVFGCIIVATKFLC